MSDIYAPHVANYFLAKAQAEGKPLTTMKLIKLVYIAHGWSLALLNRSLLGSEEVEAWQYGPVVCSLYNEFKQHGAHPIPAEHFSVIYDPINDIEPYIPFISPTDTKLIEVLDVVWKIYSPRTASSLVRLTHQTNTPWYKHYKSKPYRSGRRSIKIPTEEIKEFFIETIDEIYRNVA